MPQAPFGGVVVGWHGRLSHKDKQFLNMAFDASAELALDRQWVIPERAADGQQFPLRPLLDQPPLPRLRMGEVLPQSVELVD